MINAQSRTLEMSRYAAAWEDPPIVIVGAGPVGQRMAAELRERTPGAAVVMFGDEPWEPYDRVRLSSYLAGEVAEVAGLVALCDASRLSRYLGTAICRIDRARKVVIDSRGEECPYLRLVLATGSRPVIPPIPGVALPQVFTFRNLSDAQRLKARSVRSRHTLVIGGGLLGLEAARAMQVFNTAVTVVEQASRLMFNQLGEETAALLSEHVIRLGIRVLTRTRVEKILGEERLEGVLLSGNRRLRCDTVIIAAGIRPNVELARECGLKVGSGVLVNDQLRTSDPDIYAVGECAEHRGTVYGLVSPGYEQAAVAAFVIARGGQASYTGSLSATRLKVLDCPVMSAGEVETEWARGVLAYTDPANTQTRRVYLDGNRLDAAEAVGEWSEFARVQEAVRRRRRIWPWQLLRFRRTGYLWRQYAETCVSDWPATATVCTCTGVTRGTLTYAVDQGCTDIERLAGKTGASSVCGSCRPLLLQLLGAVSIEPVRAARVLSGAAAAGGLVSLALLLAPAIPWNATVEVPLRWDVLWADGLYKQISGYTLLGFSLLLALLSLPKRVGRIRWGDFAGWRAAHVVMGVGAALVLVIHTGLRLGSALNLFLMVSYVGAVLAGAVLSGAAGLQHALPLGLVRRTRSLSLWAHILLLWPLPGLLGFHVLKTYWF
jgi:nitrite reductase (NADH) large subunit